MKVSLYQIWTIIGIALLTLFTTAESHGYMTILMKKYNNHDSRCSDGTFCDPVGLIDVRSTACDPYFRLIADKAVSGGNGLYDYQTGVYWDADRVTFGSKFGDVANPIIVQMNYNDNPGYLKMTVTVMDKDTINADDHIDTFSESLIARADGRRHHKQLMSPPMNHILELEYFYTCHHYYYGLDCNKFCKAHDDNTNGHYTCDANGNKVCRAGWIGTDCKQRHPCFENPCLNGGTCTNVGGVASCRCPHEFTGSRCEADVNECAGRSPCMNSGTCVNHHGGFTCTCPTGLTGKLCEVDINECTEADQCANGGTCVNSFGNFSCLCPPGLRGRRCEEDLDECRSNTCLNGGTCINTFGNFSCNCTEYFTGRLCEQDVNECLVSEQCENNGTCVNTIGNFSCECPPGLTGGRCEEDVDECVESAPCRNGATCVNSFGNFSCSCLPGFSGELCELDINECVESSPCENGGTCVNNVGDFSCLCPLEFNGRFCEKPVCNGRVCANNGACEVARDRRVSCRCRVGFRGRRCEVVDPKDCRWNASCQNGGSCELMRPDSYRCNCSSGFNGSRCEIRALNYGQSQELSQNQVTWISVGIVVAAVLVIVLIGTIIAVQQRKYVSRVQKSSITLVGQRTLKENACGNRATTISSIPDEGTTTPDDETTSEYATCGDGTSVTSATLVDGHTIQENRTYGDMYSRADSPPEVASPDTTSVQHHNDST